MELIKAFDGLIDQLKINQLREKRKKEKRKIKGKSDR